MLLEPLHSILH